MLDPERARLLGRIGAHAAHAKHDSRDLTAKARETFLARFEREVDPGFVLPAEERRRRAEHARRAHFARLALASADARRKKSRASPPRARPEGSPNLEQTAA
ncbi:MAG: hypothetical protein M3Q10_07055 [Chloroflexota bacterium]|nr:hypothetical protein [Chloroflexota bacterium]